MQGHRVAGIKLADGVELHARAVILTSGTFLRGVIHIGDVSRPGGRMDDRPRQAWRNDWTGLDLPLGRLKTGTLRQGWMVGRSIGPGWNGRMAMTIRPVFVSVYFGGCTARFPAGSRIQMPRRMTSLRKTCPARPCMAGISTAWAPDIAHPSKTRSSALPIRSRTRFFWSPKASMITRSIPMGFRPHCRRTFSKTMSTRSRALRTLRFCSPAMRSNMIMSTRGF